MSETESTYNEYVGAAYAEVMTYSDAEGSGCVLTLLFFDWLGRHRPDIRANMTAKLREVGRFKSADLNKEEAFEKFFGLLKDWVALGKQGDFFFCRSRLFSFEREYPHSEIFSGRMVCFIEKLEDWNYADGFGALAQGELFMNWLGRYHDGTKTKLMDTWGAIKDIWQGGQISRFRELEDRLDEFNGLIKSAALMFRNSLGNARNILPAWAAGKGHSYNRELLENIEEDLTGWIVSPGGYGRQLPTQDFWAWFASVKVWAKFEALEEEMRTSYGTASKTFETLAQSWKESFKWAVGEYAAVVSQPGLAGAA